MSARGCTRKDCRGDHYALGLCKKHYCAVLRARTPRIKMGRPPLPASERAVKVYVFFPPRLLTALRVKHSGRRVQDVLLELARAAVEPGFVSGSAP